MSFDRTWTKLLLFFCIALTASCTHYMEVEPDHLAELSGYGEGESVVVGGGDEGEPGVELTDAHKPEVVVSRDYRCSLSEVFRHRCDAIIDVPLQQMSATDEEATLKIRTALFAEEYRTVQVPLENIDGVRLRVRNYVPTDWRRRLGLGLTFAGPAALSTVTGQFFPAESVALELGVSPQSSILNGFTGIRLRPFEFGRARPFVGTWINLLFAVDPDSAESSTWSSTGLRLGVDLQLLASKRWLLTLEANLARPLLENRELIDGISGEWIPWGGLTTSILF